MPRVDEVKIWWSVRGLVAALLVLLVLALAVAGVMYKLKLDAKARDATNYANATKQSDVLRGQRRYDAALGVLQGYEATALDSQNKTYTLVRIGAVYELKGDNPAALKYYRQAEAVRGGVQDLGVAQGIARVSATMGDKTTAVKYYNICIKLLEKDHSVAGRDDAESIKETVERIEAGK